MRFFIGVDLVFFIVSYMIRLALFRPSTGYLYLANDNLLCQEFLINSYPLLIQLVLGFVTKFWMHRYQILDAFGTKTRRGRILNG